jgi:hypothetical protein
VAILEGKTLPSSSRAIFVFGIVKVKPSAVAFFVVAD